MDNRGLILIISSVGVLGLLLSCGCSRRRPIEQLQGPLDIQPDSTIGTLAEVFSPGAVRVEGYGVVGSLAGTGSAECPPQIRAYLRQYILRQSPGIDVEQVLNNNDTAVVTILGVIPPGAYKGQVFDLQVSALPGTQTTSLKDGWLYSADLKPEGRFDTSFQILGQGEGPVYIDTLGDPIEDMKVGYILGGGKVQEEFNIGVSLRDPDYRLAGIIRDRLNGRFGDGTADATSEGQIIVKVPVKYQRQKMKFVALLQSTYVLQTPQVEEERIIQLVGQLVGSPDKESSEIALEGIGRLSLEKLEPLLNSHNEEVQFRAARCMLNLGSNKGMEALRETAINPESLYRIEAMDAILISERRDSGISLARLLLRDSDFAVKLSAYENLMVLDDVAIITQFVGRKFYMDQITQSNEKIIYVSRNGKPRIALFGSPLYCREDIFVESLDGEITINAGVGQSEVTVMRKVPRRPNLPPIKLKTSYDVSDIIRSLGAEPIVKNRRTQPGLNISYEEIILLLKQMCEKGIIGAQFREGPLTEIGL
ncbi:MAG: flagellar basal body P-ring protein FlgI [Planctomycetota bacterium]|jgi:hypothetical protein